MHIYSDIHICTHIQIYIYAHIFRYTYMHKYSDIHICTYIQIYIYAHIFRYTYMHTYSDIHICTYIQIYIYAHIFRYTYMHTYSDIHICTYIQMYIFYIYCMGVVLSKQFHSPTFSLTTTCWHTKLVRLDVKTCYLTTLLSQQTFVQSEQ